MLCVINLGNIEVSCFEFNYEKTNSKFLNFEMHL